MSAYLTVTQDGRYRMLLTEFERSVVAGEQQALSPFIIGLEAANAEYRSFRESGLFETRALERIAEVACAGFRSARDAASQPLRSRLDDIEHAVAGRLALLHASMRNACADLRDALGEMDERLRERLSEGFVDSLYPAPNEAPWAASSEEDESPPASTGLVFTH